GEQPDPRDDVHALGVIWYQLLTGELNTGPPTGLWADELEEAGLSKGLVRLLGACVGRPEKRPKDAVALAGALAELLEPPAPPPVPATPTCPEPLDTFLRTGRPGAVSWMLDLTNKQVGDAAIKALAASPRLANLSALILSGNGISDEGLAAL